MIVVMYHRIWTDAEAAHWPHIPYLHFDDWCRQLDWMAEDGRNFLLTFDDGLKCHVDLVLPELERRGLKGTFFVPARSAARSTACGIHNIHSWFGSGAIDERIAHDLKFTAAWDTAELGVHRDATRIFAISSEVRKLVAAGHRIGSHGMRHLDLCRAGEADTVSEVISSQLHLRCEFGTHVTWWAYPYGGKQSRNEWVDGTVRANYTLGFDVGDGVHDVVLGGFRILRTDCNRLPFGAVSVGVRG